MKILNSSLKGVSNDSIIKIFSKIQYEFIEENDSDFDIALENKKAIVPFFILTIKN